jgi:hypothetical protein
MHIGPKSGEESNHFSQPRYVHVHITPYPKSTSGPLHNCPTDTYPPLTIPPITSPLLISRHLYHFTPCHFHLCQVPTPLPSTSEPPLYLLIIFFLHITSIPLHLTSRLCGPHAIHSLLFPSTTSHLANLSSTIPCRARQSLCQ